MKLLVRGAQIDITLCPLEICESSTYIDNINKRYEEEKNDPILGYIINDTFYKIGTRVAQNHYTLEFAKNYKEKFWVVLNKHPNQIYNPMSYITDERSKSLVAVITKMDLD